MRRVVIAVLLVASTGSAPAGDAERWAEFTAARAEYRAALDRVREGRGTPYKLPAIDFYLFGMGGRDKSVYLGGKLLDARTGAVLRTWDVAEELIVPPAYTVALETKAGRLVVISEDEAAVWVEADGKREALSKGAVKLPDFAGRKHRLVLRVLLQELLVNVVAGRPVPNAFVYATPWYRDGAMMAMAFETTGNLPLVKDWILGLREPFDRCNNGEAEADNPGQVLYLASLVSDKTHPVVPLALKELTRLAKGAGVEGRSDFNTHPVYQTKWAKFGLKSLGLPDPYAVPKVRDTYAGLFWWDYKTDDLPSQPVFGRDAKYPYLSWASGHYAGKPAGPVGDRDYPLTWEAEASQAKYDGMARISPEYVKRRLCAPHTWHAAEAFLALREEAE